MRGMKRNLSRVLAMILSLSLLTGQAGVTSFADEYIPDEAVSAYVPDEMPDTADEYGSDADAAWPDDAGPVIAAEDGADASLLMEASGEDGSSPFTDPEGEDAYEPVFADTDE